MYVEVLLSYSCSGLLLFSLSPACRRRWQNPWLDRTSSSMLIVTQRVRRILQEVIDTVVRTLLASFISELNFSRSGLSTDSVLFKERQDLRPIWY